jgi:hypothetical protein
MVKKFYWKESNSTFSTFILVNQKYEFLTIGNTCTLNLSDLLKTKRAEGVSFERKVECGFEAERECLLFFYISSLQTTHSSPTQFNP